MQLLDSYSLVGGHVLCAHTLSHALQYRVGIQNVPTYLTIRSPLIKSRHMKRGGRGATEKFVENSVPPRLCGLRTPHPGPPSSIAGAACPKGENNTGLFTGLSWKAAHPCKEPPGNLRRLPGIDRDKLSRIVHHTIALPVPISRIGLRVIDIDELTGIPGQRVIAHVR